MKEIRLAWLPSVQHLERGVFREGGVWYADFSELRLALTFIMRTECERHGQDTHWIELRERGERM